MGRRPSPSLRIRLMLLVAAALLPTTVLLAWTAARNRDAALAAGADAHTADLLVFRELSAVVLIAMVSFGLAWVVSERFIVRYVRALGQAASRLERGDLAARADVPEGEGELSELARSFDRMAAALATHDIAMRKAGETRTRVVEMSARELAAPSASARERERLSALAEGMRDVARLPSTEGPEERSRFDLAALVRETASSFSAQVRKHRPAIVLRVKPDLGARGDRDALARVLHHLLTRAARETPTTGTLRLEARPEGGESVVRVVASGGGFTREDLSRLFAAFDTPSAQTSTDPGDLPALDLYVARTLVEASAGRFWIESDGPFTGVTYAFALPRAEANDLERAPSSAP